MTTETQAVGWAVVLIRAVVAVVAVVVAATISCRACATFPCKPGSGS